MDWRQQALVVTLASTAVLASAAEAAAGTALPRFATEVEVVTVNVAVSDPRTRQFVTGLTPGDFRVLEDGVPQQLCLFEHEKLPIEVSVLLDSSNSMAPRLSSVRAAARRLVRALRPQDRAQIVHFNQRLSMAQDYTSDQAALEAAIEGLHADGATGLYNVVYMTLKDLRARRSGDPRRRAIVVLTDGADTSSLITDDQVLELARKSEVAVYAINLSETRRIEESDRRAAHFLTALTRDTGGHAFFPKALQELDGVYDRIADELRTQYTLGYVSSNARRDGSWRAVAVQTTGSGSLLRHRSGYYGPRDRHAAGNGTVYRASGTGR